jgi:hypothetical protein
VNCKYLVFILLLISSLAVHAQKSCYPPDLIPFRKGNLWGYCDTAKKVVIKAQFEKALPFDSDYDLMEYRESNYATVFVKGTPYRIDEKGKRYEFQEAKQQVFISVEEATPDNDITSMKFKVVKENGKAGIQKMGKWLVTPGYEKIEVVSEDLERFFVKQDGKWGMLGYGMKMELPLKYDTLEFIPGAGVHNFLVAAREKGKWRIVNHRQEDIGKGQFDEILYGEDHANYYFGVKKNNKWALVDENGKPVTGFKFDKIDLSHSNKGLFKVKSKGVDYYIDCTGKAYIF